MLKIVGMLFTGVLQKTKLKLVGVYTFGFKDEMDVPIANTNSDYNEINVTMPIDDECMPRQTAMHI